MRTTSQSVDAVEIRILGVERNPVRARGRGDDPRLATHGPLFNDNLSELARHLVLDSDRRHRVQASESAEPASSDGGHLSNQYANPQFRERHHRDRALLGKLTERTILLASDEDGIRAGESPVFPTATNVAVPSAPQCFRRETAGSYATHDKLRKRMGTLIQIRDVPDDVHRRLKARAATSGVSLSEYLRSLLARNANRPTAAELGDRVRARGSAPLGEASELAVRRLRDHGE